MSTTTRNIKVKISAEIDAFNSGMKNLSSKIKDAQKEFEGLSKAGEAMTGLGKKLMPVTVAIGGIGTVSAKTAMDFQAGMNEVSAISGATGKDLEKLEKVAIDMGKSTKFSSIEASEGLKYFAMAGYSVDSMVSALPATLALATAGNTSLAETCDIVSDAMTGMQMSSKRTGEFADIMASTTSSANTSISLMGETLKYVSPVAGAMGIDMKDLSVAIGLVGNAGVKGSQAGTALRAGLTNLVKPTKEMSKAMDKYGIELKKNEDGSINLMDTMVDMRSKLGDLDQATQTATIAQIFGKEAMSAWSSVINASDKDFNKLVENIYMSDEGTRKLSESAKLSGTTLEEMQASMSVVNATFEEGIFDADGLSLALGAMAKAGYTGKEAGDALADGLSALSMPVKSVQEAMAQYGVEVVKNSDGSLNLKGTIEELRTELGGLDEDTRKQALSSIVGKENMEEWNAVISMSDKEFANLSNSIGGVTGSAEEMRKKMSEGAKGAITEMSSALQEVARTIGDRLLPFIEKCADWVGKMANKFLDLSPTMQNVIIIFAGLLAVIPPLLVVGGTLMKWFTAIKVVATVFSVSMGAVTATMLLVPVAIVAVIGAIALLIANWDKVIAWAGKVAKAIGDAWNNAVEWTKEKFSQMIDFLSEWWNNLMSNIGTWISNACKSISDGWNNAVEWTKEKWNNMLDFISEWWNNLVSSIGQWISNVTQPLVDGWNTCVETTKEIWGKATEIVSNVWETLKNLVTVGVMFIAEIIKAGVQIILLPWSFIWENCKEYVIPIFETIANFISEKLELIKTFISDKLEQAKEFFKEKFEKAKQTTIEIYTKIADTISEKLEKAKQFVSEKLEAVSNFFTEKWNKAKEKTTEIYTNISNSIKDKLEKAKNYAKEKTESIKNTVEEKWNNTKNKTVEVYSNIAKAVGDKLEQAKGYTSSKVGAIKDYFSTKFEQAKSTVVEKMNNIRQGIQDKLNGAKDIASNAINNIKSKFDVFGTVANNVKSKFDNIKTGITNAINGARDAVSNAINKIKSILGITLSFPKIKMPHFTISGKFSLNPPSVPKFSVQWYNKGAIFKRKTVLPGGIGVGDASFGGVGNSPEAILPIKKLPELLGLDKKDQNTGLTLNISEFNNNRDYDIEKLADELAYYLQRKKAFGGAR